MPRKNNIATDNEIPNLTRKQESELLRISKEGKGRAKKNAINLLIHFNKKIVRYIAKGYSSFRGQVEYEDLVQEGIRSLPKAIENFDPKNGCVFSTYAIF